MRRSVGDRESAVEDNPDMPHATPQEAAAERRQRMDVRVYTSLSVYDQDDAGDRDARPRDGLGAQASTLSHQQTRVTGRAKDLGDIESLGEEP